MAMQSRQAWIAEWASVVMLLLLIGPWGCGSQRRTETPPAPVTPTSVPFPPVGPVVAAPATLRPEALPLAVKLMTWNIQYGANGGADPNGWPQRKGLVVAALKDEAPDVFCGQEVLPGQLADLQAALADYEGVAEGRDGPGQGEHAPIFFLRSRFAATAQGTFWYNEATDKPGKDWDPAYNRICTWVELQDKVSGQTFRVWNSHFPLNADGRVKAAALLAGKVRAAGAIPALAVGDFNEPRGPAVFPQLNDAQLADGFTTAAKRSGELTFRWKNLAVSRIDWVLTRGNWKVESLRTVDREQHGVHASDHNAVVAEVKLALPDDLP